MRGRRVGRELCPRPGIRCRYIGGLPSLTLDIRQYINSLRILSNVLFLSRDLYDIKGTWKVTVSRIRLASLAVYRVLCFCAGSS